MSRTDQKHRKHFSNIVSISKLLESGKESRSSSLSDCDNDYLKETRRTAALGDDIRREIERRFRRSRVNATYVFPRVVKAKAAPTPPQAPMAAPLSLKPKLVRNKTAKSIEHSRNSSFSRLNDSHTKSNASLNVSYQKSTPTHSRNPSLSKHLPRSVKPALKSHLSSSKGKLLSLIQSPYLSKPADCRPVAKTAKAKRLVPSSLDTSLLLKPPVSKSFLKHEKMF